MTEQDRKDLLLLHAAGALDPAQDQAIQQRLAAGDPAVAGALVEAQSVLARLSGTCDPVTPSADLKQRIFDRLPEKKSVKPVSASRESGDLAPKSTSPTPLRMPSRLPAKAKTSWGHLALAAAIGGLLVGGAMVVLVLQQSGDRTRAEAAAKESLARLATTTSERDAAIKNLDTYSASADNYRAEAVKATAEKARLMLELQKQTAALAELNTLSSGDVKFTTMAVPNGNNKPYGRVIWDVNKGRWLVYIFDMAPPPDGREYQLWFLPEGGKAPIPAPVFKVDASGKATLSVELPKGIVKASAAITDEPPGGSKAPTGAIRLVGNL